MPVPITVVIPCYNCAQYVAYAIESILNQSFQNFEFIIINDGSTDKSDSIIRKYIKDRRIKYLSFEKNKGNYKARNIAMRLARGKYICVMDADDISLSGRFERQVRFMEKYPDISLAGTWGNIIDENNNISSILVKPTTHQSLKAALLINNQFIHSSLIIRRAFLKKHHICYNEGLTYSADYDLAVQCSRKARIANIDEPLVQYRVHKAQISITKHADQIMFANQVKLKQLHALKIQHTAAELNLHLSLTDRKQLDNRDIHKAVKWFNKILESNYRHRLYNQAKLYGCLEKTLQDAIVKSQQLGGWSIEKELLDYITAHYPAPMNLLEFGSGNGTSRLVRHYNVVSIEHDNAYNVKRGSHHRCILAPIESNWYKKAIVKSVLNAFQPSLILVDGPPGEQRKGILNNLDLFAMVTCPIIFDDVDRKNDKETMLKFCHALNYQYKIINGNKKDFAVCIKQLPK